MPSRFGLLTAWVLWLGLAVGCANPREQDERACAGYGCTAGQCIAAADGSPTCLCSDLDRAAGMSCELLDRNDAPDAGVFLEADAGATEQTLQERLDGQDVDWFRFEAAPKTWYRVQAASEEVPDLSAWGYPFVEDPSTPQRLYFRSEEATVAAFSLSSPSGALGRYTLELTSLGADPEPGDPLLAPTLAFDGGVQGSLSAPADVDAFVFPAKAGRAYRIDCVLADGGPCPVSISAAGQENRLASLGALHSFVIPWSDVWETVVLGPSWEEGGSAYRLDLTDWGPDPGDPTQAPLAPTDGGVLEIPTMIPGYPFAFPFETRPGDVYWATTQGASGCQPMPVTQAGDDGGTAVVKVTAGAEGDCSLRIRDVGPDDFGDGMTSLPTDVSEGSLTFLSQYPNDVEGFRLSIVDSAEYWVTCDPGCELTPAPRVLGWPGTFSSVEGGFGFGSIQNTSLEFAATGSLGSHTLTITREEDDDPTSLPITPGGSVQGVLNWSWDKDQYVLETTAGVTYQVAFDTAGGTIELYHRDKADPPYGGGVARSSPFSLTGKGSGILLQLEYPYDQTPPEEATPYTVQVTAQP